LFQLDGNGVMSKSDAAFVAARNASSPAGTPDDAPAKLVCTALALALLALAARIVSIW
jgi:hypothetical protein